MGGKTGVEPVHFKGGCCDDEGDEMNLKELRKQYKSVIAEIRALIEKEELADEDNALLTEKRDESKALRTKIDTLVELEEVESRSAVEPTKVEPPVVEGAEEVEERAGAQTHERILDKEFGFTEKCIAIRDAARSNGAVMDPRLKEERAAQGANAGLGSDGGFLIGTQAIDINKKIYDAPDSLLQYVDQRTIGAGFDSARWVDVRETSRKDTYRHGGVIGYWQGEADTVDFRNPKFEDGELKLSELLAIVPATDRMLRDAVGFESTATALIEKEFKFQINRGIVAGTGAAMPLGIRNAVAAQSIAKEGGQTADTIVFKNIVNMRSEVLPSSLASRSLVWLYHPTCFPQLSTMTMVVGTAGIPVWMPAGGISGKPYDTLYGYPAISSEFLPELGNAMDIMLVDLEEYLWISKGGVKADISIHVYFTSNQTLFRFVQAANGMPKHSSAVTLYEGTGTVSPYLYVAERA